MRLWYTYQPEELQPQAPRLRYIDAMPIPDLYLFQGTLGMEIVQASGYPADRCILTGSPRYDDLGRRVQGADGDVQGRDIGAPTDGSKQVLLSPSMSAEDARELLDVTIGVCVEMRDCRVVVKLHPECHIEGYARALEEEHGPARVRLAEDNIHDLIEGSDVVVTNYSTTGDEAIALGRPVVCYSGLRPCMATFLDIPAAPVVHNAEEMGRALERMLWDGNYRETFSNFRQELVESSFFRLDGRATDRVVAALKKGRLDTEPIEATERAQ